MVSPGETKLPELGTADLVTVISVVLCTRCITTLVCDRPGVSAMSSTALLLIVSALVSGESTCTIKVAVAAPPVPLMTPKFQTRGLVETGAGLAVPAVY